MWISFFTLHQDSGVGIIVLRWLRNFRNQAYPCSSHSLFILHCFPAHFCIVSSGFPVILQLKKKLVVEL